MCFASEWQRRSPAFPRPSSPGSRFPRVKKAKQPRSAAPLIKSVMQHVSLMLGSDKHPHQEGLTGRDPSMSSLKTTRGIQLALRTGRGVCGACSGRTGSKTNRRGRQSVWRELDSPGRVARAPAPQRHGPASPGSGLLLGRRVFRLSACLSSRRLVAGIPGLCH